MIHWVQRRNEYVYLYENSLGVSGLVGSATLFSLIGVLGATEEVKEYLREECSWDL